MITLVLSGSATSRPQAAAALKQAGFDVEDSDHPHGFEPGKGEAFLTVHGNHPDEVAKIIEPFKWALRSHWESTGPWRKIGGIDVPDPLEELKKLKAQLRAAGINLGDD